MENADIHKKLLDDVLNRKTVILEIGCGERKRDPEAIGIDIAPKDAVDYVIDGISALSVLPSESVDCIKSYHFLEHIEQLKIFLEEAARVLKPRGRLDSVVPHFSNPFYYSDPTHKSFFGLYTFSYFAECDFFTRRVPNYCRIDKLQVVKISLGFKSYPPRYIRHAFKKVVGWVVNGSFYMMETYEENLCWLVPCYEVHCIMERRE